jgi:hypothetical protein
MMIIGDYVNAEVLGLCCEFSEISPLFLPPCSTNIYVIFHEFICMLLRCAFHYTYVITITDNRCALVT